MRTESSPFYDFGNKKLHICGEGIYGGIIFIYKLMLDWGESIDDVHKNFLKHKTYIHTNDTLLNLHSLFW